jgi:hypothetical protein
MGVSGFLQGRHVVLRVGRIDATKVSNLLSVPLENPRRSDPRIPIQSPHILSRFFPCRFFPCW